jgi:SAM-dependent methyltransferase
MRTLAGMCRHVDGIDYSPTCVAASKRTNADLIAEGRVVVQQASVSNLPFPDSSFDLVVAVETHYYWPAPIQDLQQVLRVLKPGGTLLLIAETYKRERFGALLMIPMLLLRAHYLTLDQHRALLSEAGFSEIEIDCELRHGWMCGVAHRSTKVAA